MVGDRDELGIEGLLHSFQVLDAFGKKEFVLKPVAGAVPAFLTEVVLVKEVVVAHILVNIIPVPEAADIAVEDGRGVVVVCPQDLRGSLEGVVGA